MPFTFSHPAAVLPLRRLKFLQTVPLIVGSVAPDLPYFVPARFMTVRFSRVMWETHTPLGILWLDIPIGIAVLLFAYLLRGPLTALMTPRARALCLESIERLNSTPWQWLLAMVSIYVGAWTHLAWDSFTHENGWMVRRIAALSAPVTIGDYTGTMCHVLQYVSSVVGLSILAVWYLRLPTPTTDPAHATVVSPVGRALLLLLVTVTAAAIGVYIAGHALLAGYSNYRVIYLLLTRAIAGFVMLYLIAGLLVSLNRRRPEPLAEV
jgi:uncharacterized protein DUF4184